LICLQHLKDSQMARNHNGWTLQSTSQTAYTSYRWHQQAWPSQQRLGACMVSSLSSSSGKDDRVDHSWYVTVWCLWHVDRLCPPIGSALNILLRRGYEEIKMEDLEEGERKVQNTISRWCWPHLMFIQSVGTLAHVLE
jgi:hypothetical protein